MATGRGEELMPTAAAAATRAAATARALVPASRLKVAAIAATAAALTVYHSSFLGLGQREDPKGLQLIDFDPKALLGIGLVGV